MITAIRGHSQPQWDYYYVAGLIGRNRMSVWRGSGSMKLLGKNSIPVGRGMGCRNSHLPHENQQRKMLIHVRVLYGAHFLVATELLDWCIRPSCTPTVTHDARLKYRSFDRLQTLSVHHLPTTPQEIRSPKLVKKSNPKCGLTRRFHSLHVVSLARAAVEWNDSGSYSEHTSDKGALGPRILREKTNWW
ncbi:hypothetical protein EVAR_41551_1 [Eumeta japonica]|uniref:Uncharacterized protein n=1 Tax=Eumeta variegata TaxID=151549 RepID=A0A4C1Y096_EUMVA|nr:hypothetical protein EVAR_41551_1 [Eumeta japonica]